MSIQRLIGALFLVISLTKTVMAADSRPDVAQIINKAEASAILGEPVKDPSQRSGDGTDGYYSKCNYYSVQRGKSLIIRLQLPGPNAIGPKRTSAVGGGERHDGKSFQCWRRRRVYRRRESGFASKMLLLYVAKGNAFLTVGLAGLERRGGAGKGKDRRAEIAQSDRRQRRVDRQYGGKLDGPQFSGAPIIAIKCPAHIRSNSRLLSRRSRSLIEEESDGCIFQFGPNRLWIDKVPNLSHPDDWPRSKPTPRPPRRF
jgi:hypothetical protein